MLEVIQRESIYLWYYISILFRQIAPFWVAGILIGSLISVFGKGKILAIFESLKNRKIKY